MTACALLPASVALLRDNSYSSRVTRHPLVLNAATRKLTRRGNNIIVTLNGHARATLSRNVLIAYCAP